MPDNSIVRLHPEQCGGSVSAADSCVCMRHHATDRANLLEKKRTEHAKLNREPLASGFIYPFCGLPCESRLVVLHVHHRFSADDLARRAQCAPD
jgi:hypothetical protein